MGPETPLYHFGPTAQILLLGALITAAPLLWVLRRVQGRGPAALLHRLTWVTLFLTFDLVLFGAYTRLSDSGLGCPDWPGCYGQATPIGAGAQIQAAQDLMPTGPVTHGKAWVEMLHRYLATGVGGLILVLCAGAWWLRLQGHPKRSVWWPTFTLLWVCIQGAFGALTVTMKLFPAIVTLHLLGGVFLLALLAWQATQTADAAPVSGVAAHTGKGLRIALALAGGLLWMQIALGGWVSTNYAVLVCDTFPQCQGSYWPDMAFAQGFELWRPLGHTSWGELLSFQALTAIHYVHRLMAYGVIAVMLALAWLLRHHQMHRWALGLFALVCLQCLTGLSNVVLGWPMPAAILHTGGAAAMMVWIVLAWQRTRSQPLTPIAA